ncbi:hypothetical protein OUZ56_029632 [Daphnia magna]|uniref:Uncharacterized protein n=1 Tax=Daphnia magna TaxID=35525 RepID=A0ABR0B7D6_9CRUS|nr:hypothetical protein OUZ56_029632 [Daphnia magna]
MDHLARWTETFLPCGHGRCIPNSTMVLQLLVGCRRRAGPFEEFEPGFHEGLVIIENPFGFSAFIGSGCLAPHLMVGVKVTTTNYNHVFSAY